MKRKKLLFLIPLIFAFVLAFIPVAHAEENGETQTAEVFEKKSYTYKDGDDTILVTLVNETEVEFYNTKSEKSLKGTYILNGNELTVDVEEVGTETLVIGEDNSLTVKETVEKVTVKDRATDFFDKWFTIIMSAFSGITGVSIIVFLCKSIIKGLTKKLENGINLNADERKKITEDLQKTKDVLTEYQAKLETQVSDLKAMIEQFANENKELASIVKTQMQDVNKMKDLVVLLISSTPALANNGYATKILKLLGVGQPVEESEVGGNNEQEEN